MPFCISTFIDYIKYYLIFKSQVISIFLINHIATFAENKTFLMRFFFCVKIILTARTKKELLFKKKTQSFFLLQEMSRQHKPLAVLQTVCSFWWCFVQAFDFLMSTEICSLEYPFRLRFLTRPVLNIFNYTHTTHSFDKIKNEIYDPLHKRNQLLVSLVQRTNA